MQVQNPFEAKIDRLSSIEHCLLELKRSCITTATHFPSSQPDRCGFREALKFLNGEGFEISESQFYKKTSSKEVPCEYFGRKLVFSRKRLLEWLESQTVDKQDRCGIELALAKSAKRKKKGGMIHA